MQLCYTCCMKLYESAEDYLERILILSEKLEKVRAIDIVRDMGFSKPSVSIALHKLEDNGYVNILEDGQIKLTNKGKKIAESIYDRHLTLTKALMKIGVSEEQAKIDACKVEHDISQETFIKIKEAVK